MTKKRVVFYSKEDMSAGYNLENAKKLLDGLDISKKTEINDLLELYHTKLYFDADIFLPDWDVDTKESYINTVAQAFEKTKKLILSIDDTTIASIADKIEFEYIEAFWQLFNNLKAYEQISKTVFANLLQTSPSFIRSILLFKNLVTHYNHEIRVFLLSYDETAEILLSAIEQQDRYKRGSKYHFPGSLSLIDKEVIISNYLDRPNPNLNYVRLIEHSKDSSDLKLSPKTRLKAQKKSNELNSKLLENTDYSIDYGVQVSLDEDQSQPAKVWSEGYVLKASYSKRFLDSLDDDVKLFLAFFFLFDYIHEGLITLLSKDHEMDVIEKTLMKSKNEYPKGITFQNKNYMALSQLIIFNKYLKTRNKSVESILSTFINQHLNQEHNVNFKFKLPSTISTFEEKIRTLAPEFESLLKQYQLFVAEGHIDFDLLQLDSTPLRFGEVRSLVRNKYIYSNSDVVLKLKYFFFSDQSKLCYIPSSERKHCAFYDRLINEHVRFDQFANYQQKAIKYLEEEGYLIVDQDGFVRLTKVNMLYIIGELHRNEVLSYWQYTDDIRNEIDDMLDKKLLIFESTLLSKPEVNYLNYYLNKKEYTNGIDLRNKYLHGVNTSSEKEHELEYHILVKLIILVTLKIKDDLLIHRYVTKLQSNV